mgnify:CR=1 FL=1
MDVLVADPDSEQRRATVSGLTESGLSVTAVDSLSAAVDEIEDGPADQVDGVVTEYQLPDGNGLDLLEHARSAVPDAVCVVYTRVDFDAIETADYDVVAEFLSKDNPDPHDELASLLSHGATMQTHTAYPLPDEEAARVAALERYALDEDALGIALDRLTELAAAQFDVNSAGVGLIDAHHERFLSCHGADFDTTDREETVCTYTILDDGATVVEDVRDDPRFENDDWVRESDVVFYAGAPLVTDEGYAIGAFCLHDDEPRTLSDRQRRLLTLFAEETRDQLELRRRLRDNERDTDD